MPDLTDRWEELKARLAPVQAIMEQHMKEQLEAMRAILREPSEPRGESRPACCQCGAPNAPHVVLDTSGRRICDACAAKVPKMPARKIDLEDDDAAPAPEGSTPNQFTCSQCGAKFYIDLHAVPKVCPACLEQIYPWVPPHSPPCPMSSLRLPPQRCTFRAGHAGPCSFTPFGAAPAEQTAEDDPAHGWNPAADEKDFDEAEPIPLTTEEAEAALAACIQKPADPAEVERIVASVMAEDAAKLAKPYMELDSDDWHGRYLHARRQWTEENQMRKQAVKDLETLTQDLHNDIPDCFDPKHDLRTRVKEMVEYHYKQEDRITELELRVAGQFTQIAGLNNARDKQAVTLSMNEVGIASMNQQIAALVSDLKHYKERLRVALARERDASGETGTFQGAQYASLNPSSSPEGESRDDELDLDQFEGHTEGPWRIVSTNAAGESEIVGPGHSDINGKMNEWIADTYDFGDAGHKEAIANARLIAAAPSLLSLAKRLRGERDELRVIALKAHAYRHERKAALSRMDDAEAQLAAAVSTQEGLQNELLRITQQRTAYSDENDRLSARVQELENGACPSKWQTLLEKRGVQFDQMMAERNTLRAEVSRLTSERDQWQGRAEGAKAEAERQVADLQGRLESQNDIYRVLREAVPHKTHVVDMARLAVNAIKRTSAAMECVQEQPAESKGGTADGQG